MRKSAFSIAAICGFIATCSTPLSGGERGIDYVPEAGMLVYDGASRLRWRVEQNEMVALAQTLYAERPGTGVRRILRRARGLAMVRAAPRGALVGVIETSAEYDVPPERANTIGRRAGRNGDWIMEYSRYESRLVILDLDGNVVATLNDVYRFAWEPQGQRVAYITGTYHEGSDSGFDATGVWIYELATSKSRRIHDQGTDIQWAQWDGNIYIEGTSSSRVARFDPRSGRLSETSHLGIQFSADGRYYFARMSEGAGGEVYTRVDDAPVPLDMSFGVDAAASGGGGWVGVNTLVVRSIARGEDLDIDYLFDVGRGTRHRVDGVVIPISNGGDRILVLKDGTFSEQSIKAILAKP